MHYKSPDNSIHFLDDDSFADLLPVGSVPITDEEAESIRRANIPPPTPAELAAAAKLSGIEFQGVMCSATKDDQSGLMAVLMAAQLQGAAFQPTRYDFSNGNSVVLTKENMQQFIAVWMPFRQSFFVPM